MLLSVIFAILGFAFVVIIHELGHFLFAKWAGVKVLRFAIGFPPIVWEKQVGETSYAIGLIWVGGYVSLLGEEHTDGKSDPRSMLNARPGWRALILLGGVLFNLVSSWLLLVALAWYGMPIIPPVVAAIEPEVTDPLNHERRVTSPAVLLGLQIGDEIRAVNGVRTRSFEDVMNRLVVSGGVDLVLQVRREGRDLTLGEGQQIKPVRNVGSHGIPGLGIEGPAGFRIAQVADAVGQTPEDLRGPGWRLESVDGQPVAGRIGQHVQRDLEQRVGQDITFVFRRGEATYQTTLRYAGQSQPLDLAIGLPVLVSACPQAGTPAALAGLSAGDVIVAVDGQPVSGVGHFNALVQQAASAGRAMQLEIRRGVDPLMITLSAQPSSDGRSRLGLPMQPLTEGWLPVLPPAIAGQPSGLAAAGVKPGDTLLDLHIDRLDKNARRLPALVLRGGTPLTLPLVGELGAVQLKQLRGLLTSRVVAVEAEALVLADGEGQALAPIALRGLPPAMSGLRAGDWLVALRRHGEGHALLVARDAGPAETIDVPLGDGGLAFAFQPEVRPYRLEYPSEPLAIANHAAWSMVTTTLTIIPKFFKPASAEGLDATKALSGPVGIFDMMKGRFERDGFAAWLHIVALIGLNLFLVNLLPIPVVDGGQLVQLAVEVAMRRPLPDRVKAVINGIGLAMVFSLMIFALSLDILRKMGWL